MGTAHAVYWISRGLGITDVIPGGDVVSRGLGITYVIPGDIRLSRGLDFPDGKSAVLWEPTMFCRVMVG